MESNGFFVEIGRKLLPEVKWVHGSAFDRDLIESLGFFDLAIANPPFGKVPSVDRTGEWLKYRGPAHLMAAEVIVRRCERGGEMIIPAGDCSHPSFIKSELRGNRDHRTDNYNRLIEQQNQDPGRFRGR